MNEEYEFQKWESIARLYRPILITEKIEKLREVIK